MKTLKKDKKDLSNTLKVVKKILNSKRCITMKSEYHLREVVKDLQKELSNE